MLLTAIALLLPLVTYRLYLIHLSSKQKRTRKVASTSTCSVAVFLGSGGHTSEALALISSLDPQRYNRRTYIVTSGDTLSVQKALEFEIGLSEPYAPNCSILSIPRAKNVHQSLISTPFSSLLSLLHCTYHLTVRPLLYFRSAKFADVLILNGPGTCFFLCITVYINKFIGLQAPSIIYVETFARVRSLSLSGKLIRPLADRFVTQWPRSELPQEELRSDGWLV